RRQGRFRRAGAGAAAQAGGGVRHQVLKKTLNHGDTEQRRREINPSPSCLRVSVVQSSSSLPLARRGTCIRMDGAVRPVSPWRPPMRPPPFPWPLAPAPPFSPPPPPPGPRAPPQALARAADKDKDDDKTVAGDDALVKKIKNAIDEGVSYLKG